MYAVDYFHSGHIGVPKRGFFCIGKEIIFQRRMVFLFGNTNKAAMMSCENILYTCTMRKEKSC